MTTAGRLGLKSNYLPHDLDGASATRLPLVVVLHHAGAERDLADMMRINPESIGRWLAPETQQAHPCYVVAPWSSGRHWENGSWKTITPMTGQPSDNARLVLALIEDLAGSRPIDRERIYLVGQSMGAFGTWDLLARRPDLFAAAIAVCGGGDPVRAVTLGDLPIWAFHGDADTVIGVERTRQMVDALGLAGNHRLRYWEYQGAGHDQCSELAFTEAGLVEWVFAQRRSAPPRADRCGGAAPDGRVGIPVSGHNRSWGDARRSGTTLTGDDARSFQSTGMPRGDLMPLTSIGHRHLRIKAEDGTITADGPGAKSDHRNGTSFTSREISPP